MGLMFCRQTNGFADLNVTQDEDLHYSEVNVFGYANWVSSTPLMVGLTLIGGAAAKGAGFPPSLIELPCLLVFIYVHSYYILI